MSAVIWDFRDSLRSISLPARHHSKPEPERNHRDSDPRRPEESERERRIDEARESGDLDVFQYYATSRDSAARPGS